MHGVRICMKYQCKDRKFPRLRDRKVVLEMFSEMASDPEKFKKILSKFKEEN